MPPPSYAGRTAASPATWRRCPLLGQTAGASAEVVLQIAGLAKHFGGLKALDGVDIAVRRGTVHALIGPNGSGKSTFINVLTGLYKPTAGQITFCGADITALAPHRRHPGGARANLPEYPRVPRHDRAGKRHGRRRAARQ